MGANPATEQMDAAHYLEMARQGAAIGSYAELWRWLQGDVQRWLPHDALLVGWGNFRTGELHCDIVSSLAGLHGRDWSSGALAPLISYFRDCWVAAQQQPCQVDVSGCEALVTAAAPAGAREALRAMASGLVHGIPAGGHASERIFVVLNRAVDPGPSAALAFRLLVPFIDTALRQTGPTLTRQAHCERTALPRHAARMAVLSERERQIMNWVALGKTNPEIGCILAISEFTVKNHMKSIFSKLDVTNRAQAVAKLTRMSAYA